MTLAPFDCYYLGRACHDLASLKVHLVTQAIAKAAPENREAQFKALEARAWVARSHVVAAGSGGVAARRCSRAQSGGEDSFFAKGGTDQVIAGYGSDRFFAGSGAATITAGTEADIFGFVNGSPGAQ